MRTPVIDTSLLPLGEDMFGFKPRGNPRKTTQRLRAGILEGTKPEGWGLLTELAKELTSRSIEMREKPGGTRIEFPLEGTKASEEARKILSEDLNVCEAVHGVKFRLNGRAIYVGISEKDI